MRDRKKIAFFTTLSLLFLFAAFIVWRSTRAPAIARLLPESDAILYADLRPLRLATHLDQTTPTRSPDYQHFVDATGIVPERDLDQLAFALTPRPDPAGPNGPVAYTEVAAGSFDSTRLEYYLASLATVREQYAGHTVYTLLITDPAASISRELRAVILRPGLLAASNAPTPEQIHSILDHNRLGPLSSATPSLLSARFPDVPAFANAWAVGRIGLPFADSGHIALLGLTLPLAADQTFVASIRYLGSLQLRIEALAPTPEAAMQQTGALTGLLGLVRTLGQATQPSPEINAALSSVTVTQAGSRTVLRATIPLSLLHQLTAGTTPSN